MEMQTDLSMLLEKMCQRLSIVKIPNQANYKDPTYNGFLIERIKEDINGIDFTPMQYLEKAKISFDNEDILMAKKYIDIYLMKYAMNEKISHSQRMTEKWLSGDCLALEIYSKMYGETHHELMAETIALSELMINLIQ